MKTIYLCGGINGLTDAQCNDWRQKAIHALRYDFNFLDPMRRDFRGREDECVNEIVAGDYDDLVACDMVLANAVTPSWGTGMEIHHAWLLHKHNFVVCPGRVSPWLRFHSEAVVASLDEAIELLKRWR